MIYLICGLGNPGRAYQKNRHNIGFQLVDFIAQKLNITFSESSKFLGSVASKKIGDHTYILCKPSTYMNLSGQSVGALKKFYNVSNDFIWVAHDEIDIPFGEIRMKQGGGHAGHNGLRSIDAYIGKDYHRIRLGVGRPLHKEDVSNYVLSDFSKSEDVDGLIYKGWEQIYEVIFKNILI